MVAEEHSTSGAEATKKGQVLYWIRDTDVFRFISVVSEDGSCGLTEGFMYLVVPEAEEVAC